MNPPPYPYFLQKVKWIRQCITRSQTLPDRRQILQAKIKIKQIEQYTYILGNMDSGKHSNNLLQTVYFVPHQGRPPRTRA
jgi:hypothetical protein